MSKLYFYYGTVNSSKTLNLLSIAHNYRSQGKKCLLIKPSLDSRSLNIESRAGLSQEADFVISPEERVYNVAFSNPQIYLSDNSAVLVDECQFLTSDQVVEFRKLSIEFNIPVLMFGLRTKYDGTLWDASATLFAVADEVREVITVCTYCDHKAVFSKRVKGGSEDIELGWDEYIPVCPKHYYDIL